MLFLFVTDEKHGGWQVSITSFLEKRQEVFIRIGAFFRINTVYIFSHLVEIQN